MNRNPKLRKPRHLGPLIVRVPGPIIIQNIGKLMFERIRRALAQSVSDHRSLERDNKRRNFCNYLFFFVSDFIKKLAFFKNGIRKNAFQEKGSEMYSEMSSCSCFLLRLLFIVQNNAHARGAVREPRGMVIVRCLTQGGHPFFELFFGTLFSLKIAIFDENSYRNRPKMRSVGCYFSEKVRNSKSVFGSSLRVRIACEPIP